MSLIGKVFEIITDDEELLMQFPELKKGVVFKVVTTAERDRDYEDGITSVKIKDGPYLHVNGRDSWFWCFYCEDTMDQLKEIEELASDMFPEVPTGMFDGLPIVERLDAIVDELGGYNANLVIAAIDYIKKLEKQLEFSDRAF
ncbi:inhibitor of host Lon protease [Enterobacter phage vB_EclM_Q7622]|uniref:inhibitor of host Lon protease n=1 Tax=Enterobacter phage vB_EclM_Q7622 TaxID=2908628 RepID=UPI0023292BBC|nr:inhibitor of host Lon protease [Enterobacter phage vB_EclM_Q7622]UIS65598.1 inhibitor of host Lon protease [Enterobacter phage vB_EclM_Q7622]